MECKLLFPQHSNAVLCVGEVCFTLSARHGKIERRASVAVGDSSWSTSSMVLVWNVLCVYQKKKGNSKRHKQIQKKKINVFFSPLFVLITEQLNGIVQCFSCSTSFECRFFWRGAEAFLLDDTEGATSDPLFLQIYSLMSLSRMLLGFPKSSSSVTGSDPVKCSKVRSCPFIFTLLSGLDTECVCMYCMSL